MHDLRVRDTFNSNNRWKNYCERGVGRCWPGHVARMWETRELYEWFWWGKIMERGRLEAPDLYGRIVL